MLSSHPHIFYIISRKFKISLETSIIWPHIEDTPLDIDDISQMAIPYLVV